ncbi:MAG: hypothetical protein GQ570_15125 [Helicobacteraceae bacterium]|nr:hypothetical protein [Helicobacteraceae bacterium]
MKTRIEAIILTKINPFYFRNICEKLNIDSDQDFFVTPEITQIINYASQKRIKLVGYVNGFEIIEVFR